MTSRNGKEKRKLRRPSQAERNTLAADFARRYEAGDGIKAIARRSGWSYGFVHRALKDRDVKFRDRGRPTATPTKGTTR